MNLLDDDDMMTRSFNLNQIATDDESSPRLPSSRRKKSISPKRGRPMVSKQGFEQLNDSIAGISINNETQFAMNDSILPPITPLSQQQVNHDGPIVEYSISLETIEITSPRDEEHTGDKKKKKKKKKHKSKSKRERSLSPPKRQSSCMQLVQLQREPSEERLCDFNDSFVSAAEISLESLEDFGEDALIVPIGS